MASRIKMVRWRVEALAARALFGLFALLPVDWASALGGGLARLVGPWLKPSRVARRNLTNAFPELDAAVIDRLVRESWDNLGRVVAEIPHLDWLARHRVEIAGLDVLHAMRDDGLPGMFISAHFGNWELGAAIGHHEGLPITVIYRAANNPLVEDLYRKGRAAAAIGGQIAKGPQGARAAMEVLKSGGHLAMLVDQKMNDGIAVPFFGRDAMTAPAAVRFALRYHCPLVPTKVERLGGAHFRITFHPPILPDRKAEVHQETLAVMTELNAQIESWIRAAPGQWLWMHKRWPD